MQIKKRAENGTRTRDPNLGKVVLYQLSYFRKFGCKVTAYSSNNQTFLHILIYKVAYGPDILYALSA